MGKGNRQARYHGKPEARQRAREMLLEGKPVAEISKELNVANTTIYKWRRQPEFAKRLAAQHEARLFLAGDKLKSMMRLSLDVLEQIIADGGAPAGSRVKAIEVVLDRAGLTSKAPATKIIVERAPKIDAESVELAREYLAGMAAAIVPAHGE
jgi:transposase-like protein